MQVGGETDWEKSVKSCHSILAASLSANCMKHPVHNSQYNEHINDEALRTMATDSVAMGSSKVSYSVNAAHATLIK